MLDPGDDQLAIAKKLKNMRFSMDRQTGAIFGVDITKTPRSGNSDTPTFPHRIPSNESSATLVSWPYLLEYPCFRLFLFHAARLLASALFPTGVCRLVISQWRTFMYVLIINENSFKFYINLMAIRGKLFPPPLDLAFLCGNLPVLYLCIINYDPISERCHTYSEQIILTRKSSNLLTPATSSTYFLPRKA